MNPSLNQSFLQDQPGISYSNQTTTPTDTQSLIVSQPDQPAQPTQPAQTTDDMAAFKAKVEKLGMMKEAGLITEEEFAAMRSELLKNIL